MGNIIPRQAPEVGERDERVMVGEGVGTTRMERKNSKRRPAAGLARVRLTEKKGAARSVSVAARQLGEDWSRKELDENVAQLALGRDVVDDALFVDDSDAQPHEPHRKVFASITVAALPR